MPPRIPIRAGLSSLPRTPFPPPQAKSSASPATVTPDLPTPFHPEQWGSIQSPPLSALHALASRLSFTPVHSPNVPAPSPTTTADLLAQALTHPSCLPTYSQYYPNTPPPRSNKALAAVGNNLLGLFATEWVHATYPHLPTRAVKAAVSAYVGPRTLADVSKEWGALPLLRWTRVRRTNTESPVMQVDALASFPRALIALIAQRVSLAEARRFVHDHFLSRTIQLEPILKFRAPKVALTETVQKFGRERPVSRLLSETGRYSNSPIFVVGIYSGVDKLGEGFGSSMRMAEFRAAEDSLHRLYLTRQPSHLVRLPTTAFPSNFSMRTPKSFNYLASLLSASPEAPTYEAPDLGEAEVLYASAGRSGVEMRMKHETSTKEALIDVETEVAARSSA